jgi:8-oxo-dGTP diphosphatase
MSQKKTFSKTILVVVGILLRENNQVFIARRSDQVHMGGRWEFPGGKVEEGESLDQALARELQEEIDVTPLKTSHFCTLEYEYDIKNVKLECFLIHEFKGEPISKEGQPIRWIHQSELTHYDFPDANQALITRLKNFPLP